MSNDGNLRAVRALDMKRFLFVLVLALLPSGCVRSDRPSLALGSAAPDFNLPGVDGKSHTLGDFASSRVLAIVFTCNTCPHVAAVPVAHQKARRRHRDKGVTVVAINPNKAAAMQLADLGHTDVGESLDDMKVRARDRRLGYPYLSDGDTHSVSQAFGVVAMPHVFVFDQARRLRYEGRIDDNTREDKVTVRDARNAIDALLAGRAVQAAHTRVTGCPVKGGARPPARIQSSPGSKARP